MILSKPFLADLGEAFEYWRSQMLANPNLNPAAIEEVQSMTLSKWVSELLRPTVYELLGKKRINVGLDGAEGQ